MAKLTSKFIQNASCPGELNRKIYYDEFGLMLRVMGATQTKSWLFKYRWERKSTQISLGSYPQLSLAQAREERDRLRAILKKGLNPKVTKEIEKSKAIDSQQHTIQSLYERASQERINASTRPWSEAHTKRVGFIWKHLKPIYSVPIGNLTKARLRETLVLIDSEIGTATAQQAKHILSMIYSYAESNEYIPRNIIRDFANDPVLRKPQAKDVQKHPFVALENLGHTYYLIRTSKASLANKAFLFILSYTALRVGSLVNLKWSDYDEIKSVLMIPKEVVKNNRAIDVPCAVQARQLLSELKQSQMTIQGNRWRHDMYIFSETGNKPINAETGRVAFQRLLKRNNLPKSVLHGMRSQALILWSKEGFPENAVNVALDHSVVGSSSVSDRYLGEESYLSERLTMTQWIADYYDEQIKLYQANLT